MVFLKAGKLAIFSVSKQALRSHFYLPVMDLDFNAPSGAIRDMFKQMDTDNKGFIDFFDWTSLLDMEAGRARMLFQNLRAKGLANNFEQRLESFLCPVDVGDIGIVLTNGEGADQSNTARLPNPANNQPEGNSPPVDHPTDSNGASYRNWLALWSEFLFGRQRGNGAEQGQGGNAEQGGGGGNGAEQGQGGNAEQGGGEGQGRNAEQGGGDGQGGGGGNQQANTLGNGGGGD